MTIGIERGVSRLQAIRALECWLDAHDWKAWEPHDGLNTPVRRLLGANRVALLALKQLVLRSPVNLRPLLGIPRHTSPEAVGFFARGFLRLHRALGEERDRQRAVRHLDWLLAHGEAGYSGLCWGNQFDYVTRFFYLAKGTPIVVWTAHNAQALLDGYEQLGDERYLEGARSAATFVLRDLLRAQGDGSLYLSYVPYGDHPVHNANVLGAALLARVGATVGNEEMVGVARRALAYTVSHQHPDGSWWYGEAPNLRWVDNFHTGYVLECLLGYLDATGHAEFEYAMRKGLDFYAGTFFLPDGTPKYFAQRTYPLDIQCAAQSIETLRLFSRWTPGLRNRAEQVADWALANMRDPSGYFYFRRVPGATRRVPLLHWGQATMLSALAGLVEPSPRD
ncbi:MAG TPA: hypothetical protein VHJ69_04555 [Gemmatimonadales bacterium]|nr:hypothetical protein [Gemmatimonadales bacterium]